MWYKESSKSDSISTKATSYCLAASEWFSQDRFDRKRITLLTTIAAWCYTLSPVEAAELELLWGPDVNVTGPATGLTDEKWMGGGGLHQRFNADGDFFSGGSFHGKDDPDLLLPNVFGGAIVQWTGTDSFSAIYSEVDWSPGRIFPVDNGRLILDANGTIYQVGSASRIPAVIHSNAQGLIFGVGSETGRVLFRNKRADGVFNISALFAAGAVHEIFQLNAEAPGTNTTFASLELPSNRLQFTSKGHVALIADLAGDDVTVLNEKALYMERPNEEGGISLELLIRSGDPIPADNILGFTGNFRTFSTPRTVGLNGEGRVAFSINVPYTPVPSGAVETIWEVDAQGESLKLVVAERVPMKAADGGDVLFSDIQTEIRNPVLDATGRVYFDGAFVSGGVRHRGLWRKSAAGLTLIVAPDAGSLPVPESRFPTEGEDGNRSTFTVEIGRLTKMQVSPDGRVAFRAELSEQETVSDAEGNVISTPRPVLIGDGLWAQDTKGAWDMVVATVVRAVNDNNPPVGSVQQLIVSNGGNLGKAGWISMPPMEGWASNGDDGLGTPWWMPDGRLVFAVGAYTVAATVGEATAPDEFIWSGNAGDSLWESADNWVDTSGVTWTRAPGSDPGKRDRVRIGTNSAVRLNQPVSLNSLRLEGAGLEVNANLEFFSLMELDFLSELTLNSGDITGRGAINSQGDIIKSTATEVKIQVKILNLDDMDLKVEGGTLTLMNDETWIDRVTATVSSAKLDMKSQKMEVQGDSVLGAANIGSTIYLGDGEAITPISFVGGTPADKHTLELAGEGRIEIRRPMVITENDELLISNTAPYEREGVVVNLPSGQVIKTMGRGEIIFRKELRIQRGGILGNFINDGIVILRAADANETLCIGGTNSRWIQQFTKVQYEDLKNQPLSKYQIFGGSLTPKNIESSTLIFEDRTLGGGGGRLLANNTNSTVVFPTQFADSPSSFRGFVEVMGSSKLELINARMKGMVDIWVQESAGEVNMRDTTSEHLSVRGEGKVIIAGDLRAHPIGAPDIVTTKVEGQLIVEGAIRESEDEDGTKSLPKVIVEGKLTAGGWIDGSVTIPNGGELIIDDVIEDGPLITTIIDEISIGDSGKFTVKSDTAVSIDSLRHHPSGANSSGLIPAGLWTIGEHSYLDTPGSFEEGIRIGKEATVILKKAHSKFPSPFHKLRSDLVIEGTLILDGAVIDANGNSVDVPGTLKFLEGTGAKINGAMRSIPKGELPILFPLAGRIEGEIDVTGRAALFGFTGVGASPGIGTFGSDLILSDTSELRIEMSGTDAGQFDVLNVAGAAMLDGKLVFDLLNGYEPTGGEQFQFLTASSIAGDFAEVDQSRLGRNIRFDFAASATGMTATAMPLTVASYAEWRAAFFTALDAADDAISAPWQNPDGDDATNLMEYVFGGNPNLRDSAPLVATVTDGANETMATLTFNWANDVTDAEWRLESSRDLVTWLGVVPEISMIDNGDFSRTSASIPLPPDGVMYLRLELIQVP